MEDDDEFGDLYADVLRPFTTPSGSQTQQEKAPATNTRSFQGRRQIDLNNIDSDDDEILHGAANSNYNVNSNNNNNSVNSLMQKKTLALQPELEKRPGPKGMDSDRVSNPEVERMENLAGGCEKGGELDLGARVLDKSENGISKGRAFGGSNFMDEGDIDVVVEEGDDKDDDLVEKDENSVGASENFENLGEEEGEPMIPGVSSIPGVSEGVGDHGVADFDEDDDSDSEDDLQIVLNNDNEFGPMGMERMGGLGGEEDDEDGDPLVIVADNDNMGHQPMMEDQEWGEEAGAGADGERKELGDAAKVNGGVAVPPKVLFGSHAYHHPFHSQFKYVRPGAAPMPGAAPAGPGGIPGQVRPPVNMGPIAGRGRGEWRPAGIKGGPLMQKGFHPGYGMPVWGSNGSGRGLEFTLPSHKTIFEVDIDSFEEKPWKLQGIDISDFFNFGLNEESWKNYCKQLEQHRLETTMQGRIRVYESGRTEQEYDPDLPPELAAASGVQDISSENPNLVKTDAGQNDLSRGSARVRPPLPTGRPIQVETNYTDRLPSIDTRQPRIRDSDAIIEIVCQDSADEGSPENDVVEQQDQEISREDLRGADDIDDLSQENSGQFDNLSHSHNSRKKEFVGRRGHFVNPIHDKMTDGDEALPFSSESSMHRHPGSRERTPIYSGRNSGVAHEERRIKGRTRDRSPRKATSESTRDKRLIDNQKEEESYESSDGTHSPPSSAIAVDAAGENAENKITIPDESVQADESSEKEREGMAVNITTKHDMLKDENLTHSSEKEKLSSRVEQPSQETDDGEDSKAARSSENSKARSASSKDYRKSRDGVEEEVVQGGRSAHMGNIKRSIGRDENTIQRKGYHGRQETERLHTSAKGMEESYSRKGWESNSTNSLRVKMDSTDQQRESDNTERALQRSDEDLHGRRARVEDTRKRDHADEIGPRHQNKVRESERSEKDERYQLREHLDIGSRRGNHHQDMDSKHRDIDDSLKRRYENMDYLHNKRRKEDAFLRREQAGKEEILHGHRESSSYRKRERDDVSDQWKRDDQARLRVDDMYNVKHKEEGLFKRERSERQRDHDEWHRSKHSREEMLSNREREEGRSGLKSIRGAEAKVLSSHSRGKEEHKSYDREYHSKDAGRQSEQPKRRDRLENENLTQHKGREELYARVNQHSSDERRARHERESTRDNHAANNSDNHRVHEKKQKEYPRKGKESEAGDRNSLALSRRNQDEYIGQISEKASLKGKIEQRSSENVVHVNHQLSKKHNEEVSSDDEHSHSRTGRSKLERWTSHKGRDFSMSTKSSSSLQIKEFDAHNSMGPSLSSKLSAEPSKPVEDKQRPAAKDKDVPEINNVDVKVVGNKHFDTVEKLKKRSERFKLPLPSEKEAVATKKIENEPLPSSQNEVHPDTEIKPERPARKRRWTSN